MIMTPGRYLAKRRHAAGLTIEDVASAIRTDPRWGEIDRVAWIRRIEDDVAAISADVAHALAQLFPFSPPVLQQLINLRSFGGDTIEAPRLCIICGCSEHDPCRIDDGPAAPRACSWAGPDTCTRCTPIEEAA